MKKIILLSLFTFLLNAQSNDDQNIELPDFVITGVQNISFQPKDKFKPEILLQVNNIELKQSEDNDPSVSQIFKSTPPELLPPVNKPEEYLTGILQLGAGMHTLPEGFFQLTGNTNNFLISGKISGKNETEYIPNAGYTNSGLGLVSEYNLENNSSFLPGLKFRFTGDFNRETAGFFASDSSNFKRLKSAGNFGIGISNFLNDNFNYSFNYNKHITNIKETGFKENQDDFNIYVSGGISEFTVKGNLQLSNIKYSNDTLSNSTNFNKIYAGIVSDLIPGLLLEGGFNYYWDKAASRLKLNVNAEYYFGRGITFYGKYNPQAYPLTNRSLFSINRYFLPKTPIVPLINEENSLEFSAKYQLATYVEINAGFAIKKYSSLPYFVNEKGFFRLGIMNDVKENYLFANCLFHYGPFGQLFAGAKFIKTSFPGENYLPYSPSFSFTFAYLYEFDFNLKTGLSFEYSGSSFSDIQNSNKLPAELKADLNLVYSVSSDLDILLRFENLLNRKNYMFGIYRQKQIDIVAGIEYHW